jgi:hypothetical protein
MDLAAACCGEAERNAKDAPDIGFAVFKAMGCSASIIRNAFFPTSLVYAAQILADRDDVGCSHGFSADDAGTAELGQRLEGSEFAVEIELAADFVDETIAAWTAE